MRTRRRANEATSDERQKLAAARGDATFEQVAGAGVPNKPVLPTAPASPNHHAPGPLRRQTGQPSGGDPSHGE